MELLRVKGNGWEQVSYETGDHMIREVAKDARDQGKRVVVGSMGMQVTQYGVFKMTMVTIFDKCNTLTGEVIS